MIGASEFRAVLSATEIATLEWWVNMGSRMLREFSCTGDLPPNCDRERFDELLRYLNSALAKAPPHSGLVYRGMGASPLWQDCVRELRALIGSNEEFVAPRHLSASLSEEIGVGHCYIEPTDPVREISVLLACRVVNAPALPGFINRAKDEREVVLLKGSRFRRLGTYRLASPRPGQELWRIDLEQVA
jgi:hypothetical protein